MPTLRMFEYDYEITDIMVLDILDGGQVTGKRLHCIKSRELELIDHIITHWKERHLAENPDSDPEPDVYTAPTDEGTFLLALIGN